VCGRRDQASQALSSRLTAQPVRALYPRFCGHQTRARLDGPAHFAASACVRGDRAGRDAGRGLRRPLQLALGRPTPHHIPAGLVGPSGASPHAVPDLEHALAGALEFRRFAHPAGARRAIRRQEIYTALVLTHHPPRLLVATAASASVSRLMEQTVQKVTAAGGPRIQVVDIVPLPASDPNGLTVFYVTLAATIVGFLAMFQLRTNAGTVSRRACSRSSCSWRSGPASLSRVRHRP
jgi:hypothetical protein